MKKNKFKTFTVKNLSEGPIIQAFYCFRKLTPEQEETLKKTVAQLNQTLGRQ